MSTTITLEMILEQLSKVMNSNAFFENALQTLISMTSSATPTECGAPPDLAGQARAQAVADICRARETTNQQLIRFYEKMYEDMMAMEGLRQENKAVINTDALKGTLHIPTAPDVPPVPELPDMPDIPPVPPV